MGLSMTPRRGRWNGVIFSSTVAVPFRNPRRVDRLPAASFAERAGANSILLSPHHLLTRTPHRIGGRTGNALARSGKADLPHS